MWEGYDYGLAAGASTINATGLCNDCRVKLGLPGSRAA
jgi:hypothetical protein